MNQILITTIVAFILLLLFHNFYKDKLGPKAQVYHDYNIAVEILHATLAQKIDLKQHHFQPCRSCGYALALQRDSSYCVKSDVYKLLHPKMVNDYLLVFRDYAGIDLARNVIRAQMYDALPSFVQNGGYNISKLKSLPLSTQVIYPYAKNYFRTHTLGSQAGCLFQKYAHVPGQDDISIKTNQSHHFQNYINRLQSEKRPQECIDDAKFMKKTFMLQKHSECMAFFDIINSQQYQDLLANKGIQYIFKTNRHLGNGIMVLDKESENIIREWYQNGQGCGKNASQSLIQEYITNPYLYNGHKMEFRAYFIIASTNPPIIYVYKKALIKQCALSFDLKNPTKQGHVCNTAITKSHDEAKDDSDSHYIDWNLEELQDLLLQQGRIKSKDWLNEYLRPQMYRKITHLYLSVKDFFFKDSRVSEFFGVDFLMDDDLRLWIFECNRNPNFLAVTQGRFDMFGGLLTEMLNLSHLQIKSKYKRIKKFIDTNMLNDLRVFNSDQQKEFMDIQEDFLDDEFQLPQDSSLELVYVDTTNKHRYQQKEYLPKECMID